jgi:hypothetical protein
MAKNILVLADGTGNEGGLLPDESRTNVYKLYRATRNGPDLKIDPRKQIAFYLHGIGTPTPGLSSRWQRIREAIEQMIGGGLTGRIIDGYAAIVSVWQPGDRIYLFGFSRGAYTEGTQHGRSVPQEFSSARPERSQGRAVCWCVVSNPARYPAPPPLDSRRRLGMASF